MQAKDLKPAGALAQKYGVKAILYGRAGTGKTPMLSTAPRPVLLSVEPGLKSMSGSTVPTWEAHSMGKIEEFFQWFLSSNESKNFDTLCIDSGSQIAEIVLTEYLDKFKDGRKVYGEMSRTVSGWFNDLFFLPNKHIVLICKETKEEVGSDVINVGGQIQVVTKTRLRPYFPGQDLNVKIPHQYDEILHIDHRNVPGVGKTVALFTKGSEEIYARDRSGNLDPLEPPDWSIIFNKCMAV